MKLVWKKWDYFVLCGGAVPVLMAKMSIQILVKVWSGRRLPSDSWWPTSDAKSTEIHSAGARTLFQNMLRNFEPSPCSSQALKTLILVNVESELGSRAIVGTCKPLYKGYWVTGKLVLDSRDLWINHLAKLEVVFDKVSVISYEINRFELITMVYLWV